MENLLIETGQVSVNKHGESLCGDFCQVVREGEGLTAVLSDGLGSGVKANILSTLTATILSTLLSHSLPADECVEAVATTLPMCKERRLAYATFTAALVKNGQARLIQYDNPRAILLRGGKSAEYSDSVQFVGTKEIHESRLLLRENDVLVLMSDGVTNAGLGKLTAEGWPREEVVRCLERLYAPETCARHLAAQLVNAARTLCEDSPDDDITALVLRVRAHRAVNLLIGPPADAREDGQILRLFFAKEGPHVVCGGTTAKVVARFLKKTVLPVPESAVDGVPAVSSLEGVDLVTEGVLTLRRAVELVGRYEAEPDVSLELENKKDGASRLAQLLCEQATDVNIFFGQAVNEENEGDEIDFSAKHALVQQIREGLAKMGKNVKVSLC